MSALGLVDAPGWRHYAWRSTGPTSSTVHRYYDPTTGQFLSVDPLVETTGQAYSYVGDDPVNTSDPLGLSGNPEDVVCSGGGPGSKAQQKQECEAATANTKHVVAEEESDQYLPKALPGVAYASVCGDFWIVKGCLSITGGQLHVSFGYGFGTPGADISAGVASRCDAGSLLGGWSNSTGAEYWVGGGYASSPNGVQGPYVSSGTPGFGTFKTHGWRLPW